MKGPSADRYSRVSVVDDNRYIRLSLEEMLNSLEGFKCLKTFPNAEVALKQIDRQTPDILLMDIEMPRMSGIECARRLLQQHPCLPIIALTRHLDRKTVAAALKIGMRGYLLKPIERRTLEQHLKMAREGQSPLSPEVNGTVLSLIYEQGQPGGGSDNNGGLSPREQEVMRLLVDGMTDKEIADDLKIQPLTVNSHTKKIYRKLGVRSRVEAVALWLKRGR